MDTITHGIAGALAGKALAGERQDRFVVWVVTIGAVFPDSDVLANLFTTNNLLRLEIHRGITPSLVALPFFAALLGVATGLWTRQRRWFRFALLYATGIFLHILMDLITSYGTMIWNPLSRTRAAWDLTFIIDLVFTTVLLLPQLMAWVYSDRQRARRRGWLVWLALTAAGAALGQLILSLQIPLSIWSIPAISATIGMFLLLPATRGRGFEWPRSAYCRAGVSAMALYLGFCGVAHHAALKQVSAIARSSGWTVMGMAALPAPPSFWRWSGLVQTADGVHRIPLDLTDSRPSGSQFFANARENGFLRAAEQRQEVQTYLWFARFPWVTYRQNGALHIVEYQDLQFLRPAQNSPPPFTLRVSLDNSGRVLSAGLLQP